MGSFTHMKHFFILLALLSLTAHRANAQDLSDIWCDALTKETQYELAGLDNYKLFVEGEDGWVFRSNTGFRDGFFTSRKTQSYIKTLQQKFKERGTDLVILYPPPRSIVHYNHVKKSDQEQLGLNEQQAQDALQHYADFLREVRSKGINMVGLPEFDPDLQMYFKRDHHWTPEGAREAANAVASFVKTLPSYETLKKTEYVTTAGDVEDYKGAFKRVFKKLCNTEMPPEPRIHYETQAKTGAHSESDLFGDATEPEVVLFGTSNSSTKSNVANFEGFLKEALSADVENLAVTGAGTDTSMIAYLNSERAKTNPAKIAIWEVPGYYNFDHMRSKVFLQAIPAVQGSCADNPVAKNEGFQIISPEEYPLFPNIKDLDIADGRHYVYLNFSRPVSANFFIAPDYNQFKDINEFERSSRYPAPDGEYYFWIDRVRYGNPRNIFLKPDIEMAGVKGSAYLCRLTD